MSRFPRFTRLAAVGALLLSALALTAAPAGAVPAATGSTVDNGNGTATVTYAGTTDPKVYLIGRDYVCEDSGSQPVSGAWTWTVGASPMTISAQTLVGPTGPPGSPLVAGFYKVCLYDVVGATWTLVNASAPVAIYRHVATSLTAGPDGTMLVTYDDLGTDTTAQLVLLANVTECPTDQSSLIADVISGFLMQAGLNLPASPGVVEVGSPAWALPTSYSGGFPPDVPITAGQYQACMYTTNVTGFVLSSSLQVTIGAVTPAFTG